MYPTKTSTPSVLTVHAVDRHGAVLSSSAQQRIHVAWADLQAAARQDDPELRQAYAAALTEAQRWERGVCLSQAGQAERAVWVGAQRQGPGSPAYEAVLAVVCPSGQVVDILRGVLPWPFRLPHEGGAHYDFSLAQREADEAADRLRARWPRAVFRIPRLTPVGLVDWDDAQRGATW